MSEKAGAKDEAAYNVAKHLYEMAKLGHRDEERIITSSREILDSHAIGRNVDDEQFLKCYDFFADLIKSRQKITSIVDLKNKIDYVIAAE